MIFISSSPSAKASVFRLAGGLLAGLMIASAAPAAAKPKAPAAKAPATKVVAKYTIESAMTEVIAALDRRDCAAALPGLDYLWDNAELKESEPELSTQMRRQRVLCVALVSGPKAALELSDINLKAPGADADAYGVHMLLQLQASDIPAALKTLNLTLDRFPDNLADLNDEAVLGVIGALKETDKPAFAQALDRLTEAGWEPGVTSRGYEHFLSLERLRDLTKTGPKDKIDAYRDKLSSDGFFYMVMMSDQTLTPASVKPKPLSAIVNDEIVEAKIALIKQPENLTIVDNLTSLYAQIDQEQQSISLLTRYIDMVDENGLFNFAEPDAYQNLLVKKAGMLANQNRHDEVMEVFHKGESMLAWQDNFDFYMGYMNYLTDMGREKDSLALEAKIDKASLNEANTPDLEAHKACAYAYLKDKTGYETAMKKVPENTMVRLKPLICARDEAGAVANIIGMLNHPDTRADAAVLIQDTLPPKPWTPRDQAYVDMFTKVRQSPAVLAAAKTAGITVRKWDVRY